MIEAVINMIHSAGIEANIYNALRPRDDDDSDGDDRGSSRRKSKRKKRR